MNTNPGKKTISLNKLLLKKRKELPPPQKAFKNKKTYSRKNALNETNRD